MDKLVNLLSFFYPMLGSITIDEYTVKDLVHLLSNVLEQESSLWDA